MQLAWLFLLSLKLDALEKLLLLLDGLISSGGVLLSCSSKLCLRMGLSLLLYNIDVSEP